MFQLFCDWLAVLARKYRIGDVRSTVSLADELVSHRVSLIATVTLPAAVAAKSASPKTPVVFVIGEDPVKAGLVASLDRPGGNATGVSDFVNQLVAKRLELIQQAIPRADLVGLLVNPNNPNADSDSKELLVADQNEHRPNDIRSSGYAQWVATGACNSRIHRRANPRIIPRGAAEKPDHGIAGCCARATNGHAAAVPRPAMSRRRFTQ